ncbi:MAG: ATP-dependent DNA helicase, partial [Ignavibacteria bacterium]|nr:ATP-dependent DNA helicase [Ignavibacteria bacterium]MCU7514700.1 ATP-dependent DNA helicase [Ignavibacteria bacterium]MCU7518550.1 ATP-dependent DNA helicase [Ignavibacteria bacterium]
MSFKESETVELKKTTGELKEALVSMAAMLNRQQRGEVYFGIKDNGIVLGQSISENTIREISRAISDKIEPRIYPEIEVISIEGKSCIRVFIEGFHAPYSADGRYYLRIGDEDRKMTSAEVSRFILDNNLKNLRWDTQPCAKAKLSDISTSKIREFLSSAGLKYTSVQNSLENFNLLENDQMLNAAVIMFGRNPEKFFRNASLRCAVMAGTNTSLIIDRKEYSGDIISLIRIAEEFILKNIHIGMQVEGLFRKDIPEIDTEALREAITNAFCHRDYFDPDSVTVMIFSDRVEIRNPGGLFGGLTISEIRNRNISRRRNELIAEVLHRIHLVERFGRGISFILNREPATEFILVGDIFIASFRRKSVLKPKS